MRLVWKITSRDCEKIRSLLEERQNDPFVVQRIERNILSGKALPSRGQFWKQVIACLLTTQQRSGPGSPVTRFIRTEPFPLSYKYCRQRQDLQKAVQERLRSEGGLRRKSSIAKYASSNLKRLEMGLWEEVFRSLHLLLEGESPRMEREAAKFIQANLDGFGPKQSRNLLQSLGLTRYEIPIDSRVIKWLNEYSFPIRLSSQALSDENYYEFVLDGVQHLCARCEIYPCVLDAAIFTSYDKGEWTEANVVF